MIFRETPHEHHSIGDLLVLTHGSHETFVHITESNRTKARFMYFSWIIVTWRVKYLRRHINLLLVWTVLETSSTFHYMYWQIIYICGNGFGNRNSLNS